MFGNVLGSIAKIFGGSAQEKSLKELQPAVEEINTHFQSFTTLSHDELRGKTNEFRQRITDYLKDIDTEIQEKNEKVESLPNEAALEKEEIYEEITNLEKSRDEKLEEILEELLPEAFAVVKES
ncbi:MAG: preprotein translocase subunit SecA, partial [Bacteroidia bacterium]|nr:preprotein translocase subunit SecA [Bacteroidia bacterium]